MLMAASSAREERELFGVAAVDSTSGVRRARETRSILSTWLLETNHPGT
jgi:hypothetical protein